MACVTGPTVGVMRAWNKDKANVYSLESKEKWGNTMQELPQEDR